MDNDKKPENPVKANAPQVAEAALTAEELIQRCMERATKVTYRQRPGKRGTSITISFRS